MNEIPESIYHLADKNVGTLKSLALPTQSTDYKTLSKSLEAGQTVLSHFYPGTDLSAVNDIYRYPDSEIESDKCCLSEHLIHEFDPELVLIRPEMYHKSNQIIDFLRDNGFLVTYESDRVIDPRSYAVMYGSAFAEPHAKPSWPTRTMVYIGSPVRLIVFTDPKNRFFPERLADGFVRVYKGREGIKNPNTLRGSVVFQEAIRLGLHTLNNKTVARAVDPIHAYRHIVHQSGSEYPHSSLPTQFALLKYDAVSVHAPNSTELNRDLSILNTFNQLKEIHELLRK